MLKNFRLSIVFFLYLFLYLVTFVNTASALEDKQKLTILSFADYIDPDVIKKFEIKNKIEVKIVFFETDEERDRKLAYTSGKGYDLILVSGPYINPYIKRNWIIPLDKEKIPNVKHISQRWLDAYPDSYTYAIPYLWGALGIAYRQDLVSEKIESWSQLFKASPNLNSKVGMINDSKEVVGMALKSLNYSINSSDRKELAQVKKLLLSQKSYVFRYDTPDLTKNSPLVKGEISLSLFYNGDALFVSEFNPLIKFAFPIEGTGLWVDYFTVAKSSENKELAMKFINYINIPKNAAQIAQYLNYASPNKGAEQLLPESHLKNPIIYPTNDILSKSEFFQKLPPRSERKRNLIFSAITR